MISRRSLCHAHSSTAFLLPLILISISPLVQASTWTVGNMGDPASGNAANCGFGQAATCTLRDAMAAAGSGDTIVFAPPNPYPPGNTITLINGALTWPNHDNITIDGTNVVNYGFQSLSFPIAVDGNHSSGVFALNVVSSATIENLTIQNGSAMAGGGVLSIYSTLTLKNVTLSGNVATQDRGGGIYVYQGAVTLTGSTLVGNNAPGFTGCGGGIYVYQASATLTNSTFSANGSTLNGGAICTGGASSVTVTNCTLAGNGTATSSAIVGSATLANTIIYNDFSSLNSSCSGPVGDSGGNLDSGSSCGFSGVSAGTSWSNVSLLLGPLQDNGGPTKTMMTLPTYLTVNPINWVTCANAPATDQRGVARPQSIGCDSGAVEVRPYTLTMAVVGSGTVTSNVEDLPNNSFPVYTNGITDCAAGPTGTCSADYAEQSNVGLTATPASGWHLDSWGGDCATIAPNIGGTTMNANNKSCTATFAVNAPLLNLSVGGAGGYASYGQMLTYTATLGNSGTADATSTAVDFVLSAGLDAANASWGCLAAGGATCPASSSASMVVPTLPVGGTLTWTLHVPVLAATPELTVSVQGSLNSVLQATDTATLVIFRDSFEGN